MVAVSTANRDADVPQHWTCLDVFRAVLVERIALIKSGVSAHWVKTALGDFMRECGQHLSAAGLSQADVSRKAALNAPLSLGKSECVVGIAGLIGQVEAMVKESGAPEGFNASIWFAEWVISPLPALGGDRPIEYLDTWDGRTVISRLLGQMQSSAYA
jgi:uncharacterized protein (DUF2384 family)